MDSLEYERMYLVETRHWWYQGMEALTRALLDHYVRSRGLNILDAGCGTGAAMSTYLAEYGRVTGIDVSPLALQFSRERHLATLAQASVMSIPLKTGSFDLVTSFDVLYERAVTDEALAVSEFFRVLRPGGYLLLRLPAYDWLRGHHDVTIHTARRYTTGRIAQLLQGGGFKLLRLSYANTILFPLALAKRFSERFWPPDPNSSDLSVEMGVLNGWFKRILSSEAPLVTRVGLPFGLSVIVLAQKPESD